MEDGSMVTTGVITRPVSTETVGEIAVVGAASCTCGTSASTDELVRIFADNVVGRPPALVAWPGRLVVGTTSVSDVGRIADGRDVETAGGAETSKVGINDWAAVEGFRVDVSRSKEAPLGLNEDTWGSITEEKAIFAGGSDAVLLSGARLLIRGTALVYSGTLEACNVSSVPGRATEDSVDGWSGNCCGGPDVDGLGGRIAPCSVDKGGATRLPDALARDIASIGGALGTERNACGDVRMLVSCGEVVRSESNVEGIALDTMVLTLSACVLTSAVVGRGGSTETRELRSIGSATCGTVDG